MSRKEEFNLRFEKYIRQTGTEVYYCDTSALGQSRTFALILSGYDRFYTDDLIEEIENAQAWDYYVDYHHPDSLTEHFAVIIVPPNVLISSHNYQIPLQVWKELMQEWLAFLNI